MSNDNYDDCGNGDYGDGGRDYGDDDGDYGDDDDDGDYGDDDDGGDYGGANDDVADSNLKEQHAGNKSKSRGTAKTSGVYLKQSL